MSFNIQSALHDMEARIREDIAQVSATARRDADDARDAAAAARSAADDARRAADAAILAQAVLDGRILSLEEKAKWLASGIASAIVAMIGFVWHVVTHRT